MSALGRALLTIVSRTGRNRYFSRMACNPDTGTFKYFSFGSNLLRERILICNPTAKFYGVGTLHGYELIFDTPSGMNGEDDVWLGAAATIRPAGADSYVCGVVWDIETTQMEYLDKQEEFYSGIEVEVNVNQGETITCRTYQMNPDTKNIHLPSPHYKKVILAGAKQNGLSEEYIRYLESFPDNGIKETPLMYSKVVEMVKKFRKEKGSLEGTIQVELEPL